jgi:WD40 repeat protein
VSLALSPDGSRAVTAGKDGSIHVWDTRSGAELLSPVVKDLRINLNVHPATVYPVVFTLDGGRLVTACFDQSFRIWDATPQPGPKP